MKRKVIICFANTGNLTLSIIKVVSDKVGSLCITTPEIGGVLLSKSIINVFVVKWQVFSTELLPTVVSTLTGVKEQN
jgi:hypothetical protein